MNAVVTQQQSNTPMALPPKAGSAVYANAPADVGNEMSDGIGASFAKVTLRGKVWGVRHRGENYSFTMDHPQGPQYPAIPRPNIEVVICRASPAIAKIWYEGKFEEGSTAPPDCWSVNGLNPDPASAKKQSTQCAGCPQNAWGSKMNEGTGKAGKACQDSKRLALLPIPDLRNELLGGPMLLQIPAATLKDMDAYNKWLQSQGYKYYEVVTSLSFDTTVAYPKIVFTALRPCTDAEAAIVVEMMNDARTKRILEEEVREVRAEVPQIAAPSAMQQPLPPARAAFAWPAGTQTHDNGDGTTLGWLNGAWMTQAQYTATIARAATPTAVEPTASPMWTPPAQTARTTTPAPEVDPYQYTADGLHRWKEGMAAWEPVPVTPQVTAPAIPAPSAPSAPMQTVLPPLAPVAPPLAPRPMLEEPRPDLVIVPHSTAYVAPTPPMPTGLPEAVARPSVPSAVLAGVPTQTPQELAMAQQIADLTAKLAATPAAAPRKPRAKVTPPPSPAPTASVPPPPMTMQPATQAVSPPAAPVAAPVQPSAPVLAPPPPPPPAPTAAIDPHTAAGPGDLDAQIAALM